MTTQHLTQDAAPRRRRTGRRRRIAVLGVLAALSLVLTACGSGDSDKEGSSGGKLVSLSGTNGDPSNGPSGSPFGSMQIAEGWDKASGYELKWDVSQSAAASMQLLSSNSAELGQSSTALAYASAKLDPNLRIIGFLNGPEYLIVAPENSGITTAADLKGKTIGVQALGSASHLMVLGSIKAAGLTEKDIKVLPVGLGAPMAEGLDSGKIDAIAGWEGMWQSISALTKEPLAPVESKMSELVGLMSFLTTQKVIDENRDALVAYVQNFYKGCALAAADPTLAVENHWKVFPKVAPPASERDTQLKNFAEWNQDFFKYCAQPSPEAGTVGAPSDNELKEAYEFMRENNILEDDVDFTKVVDTSIVKDALKDVDLDAWVADYQKK